MATTTRASATISRGQTRRWRFANVVALIRRGLEIFFAKNAQSRGAALAFYAVTSIAPVLLIAIVVAGAVFGDEAARGVIFAQFRNLIGPDGAALLEQAIVSASAAKVGVIASVIGIATLIITASGVFLELEDALNEIWGVKHEGGMLSGLVRARLASLGLVAALGFLLIVSLVLDAGLSGLHDFIDARWPPGASLLMALNFLVTLFLMAVLFAAIYKLLPAKPLAWPYVIFGAALTAVLFQLGKFRQLWTRLEPWRSWLHPWIASVDLLLGPDFPVRRGAHQSALRPPSHGPRTTTACDALSGGRVAQSETPPAKGGVSAFAFAVQPSRTSSAERSLPHVLG
jgi:membrane protein